MVKLDFDSINQVEIPDIYLANKNKDIIGCLYPVNDFKIQLKLNDVNTISFTMYETVDNKINPYYDELVELKLVFIQKYGWFQISVTSFQDGISAYKEVTGSSLEVELGQVNLIDFEVNSGDIEYDEYDEWNPIVFCDFINPTHSLLHLALQNTPAWSVGHVDSKLMNKQRSFDVDEQDIHSFLTSEVSQAFECLFIFDSFNRTVNAYVIDDYGIDTNIFINFENLAKEIEINVDDSQIKTTLRIRGGENIQVEEVNPNGKDTITNMSYYLPCMTEGTRQAYLNYSSAVESKMLEYQSVMEEIQGFVDIIYELLTRVPSNLTTTNWTECGLNFLESKEETYKNIENNYITLGIGNANSNQYNSLYVPNHNLLLSVQSAIKVRKSEIELQENLQANAEQRRLDIANFINIKNFFTDEQWKELSLYNREDTYSNENFITTSLDTDKDRIATTLELYDTAKKELEKVCHPQYAFSSTLNNLLAIPEFESIVEHFDLGNFIRIGVSDDYVTRLRIISIGLDFTDLSNIDVEFSDMININSVQNDLSSILDQAGNTATSVDFNKKQWNKGATEGNWVSEMRQNGLDSALVSIVNGKNQSQVIDEYGILLREWNEQRLDFELEQAKLINNMFAFSDDAWKSVRMALGKIRITNPSGVVTECYGLIADALVSKILITESTYIGNSNNTFTIDDHGLAGYSQDKKTVVKIDPNNNNGLMEIIKNYKLPNQSRIFYIDSNGDLRITGHITASSITLTNLEGVNINNGNGTFTVTADGHVHAESGDIAGFFMADDVLWAGEGDKFIRISPSHTYINGDYASIDLGLNRVINPSTGYQDTIIHLRSDGYARFGLNSEDGAIKFNHIANDFQGVERKFNLFSKNFRIANDGLVTSTGINLNNGSPIRGYDTSGKEHNLVNFSGNNNVVLGEQNDPQNCHIYGLKEIALYIGSDNNKAFIMGVDDIKVKLPMNITNDVNCNNINILNNLNVKGLIKVDKSLEVATTAKIGGSLNVTGSIQSNSSIEASGIIRTGGKEVATKSDLDSLETEWQALLQTSHDNGFKKGKEEGYASGYTKGKSDGYSDGYSKGESDGYSRGYNSGESDGYSRGYSNGYNAGFLAGSGGGIS